MKTLQDAIEEIRSNLNGQSPSDIFTDSKIYRFGKNDSCWYAANEWEYKGNFYFTVNYGDWKTGQEITFKSFDQKQSLDKNFINAQRKKTEENQAKLQHEKETLEKKCKEKWLPVFKKAHRKTGHEYLENKKIKNLYTAKIDHNKTLLIPVYNHEGFQGVQLIFKDAETQKFIKRFSRGVRIKGGICPLVPFKDADCVYLSEGFATAASVQMAFPSIPSICAFNAGNLLHAINTIRNINPKCKIIIATDYDAVSKEGERRASYCAKVFPDVIFKVVRFSPNSPKEWSDYNDLHCFDSLESVIDQLAIDQDDFFEVNFLGCSIERKTFYYSSSDNKSVIAMTAKDHASRPMLYSIAPRSWYQKKFPKIETSEGQKKITGIDWELVIDTFIQKNKSKGFWDRNNERGLGIWRDQGRYVFNDGEKIRPNLKETKYFYTPGFGDYGIDLNKEMTLHDMKVIKEAVHLMSFGQRESVIYFLGWIVQSNILTVLPWKFHIWITGESNSGKSWLQDFLKDIVYNCQKFDNSSIAGMQAKIGHNATPFVFDESEPSKNGILGLLHFTREGNNPEGAAKLRSNSHQEIFEQRYHYTVAFGSIQLPEFEPQDRNRYFIIETVTREESGQSEEDFQKILAVAEVLKKNKNAFFARCFRRIPQILENQKIIEKYLKENRDFKLQRTSLQLSILISCYFEFCSDEKITENDIEKIMSDYNLDKSEYIEHSKIDHAQECFDALMSMEVDNYKQRTLSHCIDNIVKYQDRTDKDSGRNVFTDEDIGILASWGIRVIDNEFLLIHVSSKKIQNKLKDFSDYARILRRSKALCVRKNDRQRIKGYHQNSVRCVKIKFKQ